MKIVRTETKIFHCGECCWAEPKEKMGDWYCFKTKKDIPSLWEKPIPEWCPLPSRTKCCECGKELDLEADYPIICDECAEKELFTEKDWKEIDAGNREAD